MRIELTEIGWLHEHRNLAIAELAELSGLSEAEIAELIDCGVLAPNDSGMNELSFDAQSLHIARTACRLRNDFELNTQGVVLAVTLLDRIHELEAQLKSLRARLPRRVC
jgi:chaperone modulatory protein CbpM